MKLCKCGKYMIVRPYQQENFVHIWDSNDKEKRYFPQKYWCSGCGHEESAPSIKIKDISEKELEDFYMKEWRLANVQQ